MEVFKQVKCSILCLNAIMQIPSYTKFLIHFSLRRELLVLSKKEFLTVNISKILSKSMPIKYKDPNYPTILCTICNTIIDKILFDLGASGNLIPRSFYKQLGVGELN